MVKFWPKSVYVIIECPLVRNKQRKKICAVAVQTSFESPVPVDAFATKETKRRRVEILSMASKDDSDAAFAEYKMLTVSSTGRLLRRNEIIYQRHRR